MKKILITLSNEYGIVKIREIDGSSEKNLAKGLFDFFVYTDKLKNDYKDKIKETDSDIDIINFFLNKIRKGFLANGFSLIYHLFDIENSYKKINVRDLEAKFHYNKESSNN